MKLPWSKNKPIATKSFIQITHKKDTIRIWIDQYHVPYKIELRFDDLLMGYMNVDEFMVKFRERFHA